MEDTETRGQPRRPGLLSGTAAFFGALPAGVGAGAVSGAVIGGVAGRIVMRLIFLIEKSKDGAETDFGTVGEITVGGSLTLIVLSTIAGAIGGAVYVGIRRWLPWPMPAARGVFFGLLMMFAPGVIFLGEVDLQIFEPALPIFAMFVALITLYGVSVALITDRLRPPLAPQAGPRMEFAARWLVRLAAIGILIMAVATTYNVNDKAGTCLTADGNGGCGIHTRDIPATGR